MLDNRLKICSDFVSGKGVACDVGTDHAYLAADLILSGKCKKVIASDINQGPLEAAEKTVEKYEISDNVELILSNGLENVPPDDLTDIIIAGMGGETIADILEKCEWARYGVNLILQPMTKISFLRKWLYDNGYEIKTEKLAKDGEKLYTVMQAVWTACLKKLSDADSVRGFFAEDDMLADSYLNSEAEKLERVSVSLKNAGRNYESMHNNSLSNIVRNGAKTFSVSEIYDYLDSLYPLSVQEKWDNPCLLIESTYMECKKVLLTLDIDYRNCFNAKRYGAELIISHHPVIFEPLKKITANSAVHYLVKNDISAICMHTNLDIASGGTNGVILKKLADKYEFEGEAEPFEDCGGGNTLGYICNLKESVSAEDFGKTLKEIFGCEYVRMNRNCRKNVKRFAFCSGSGGSSLDIAIEKKCDAYITGDVKHNFWIDANNDNFILYDCGHFHTENLVLEELRYVLEKKFPQLEVIISDCSVDPVMYIK